MSVPLQYKARIILSLTAKVIPIMKNKVKGLKWTTSGFLAHLKWFDEHMQDRALAFIIGAGASRPSRIKTGAELVTQWLKELHHREDHAKQELQTWATEDNLGIKDFEFPRAAEFYPQIFERRFSHDREEGYAFLESMMEGKEPSLGYSILAEILSNTRHKVVVTTNFDNLVADALAIHAHVHPLICGHESLAGFIRPSMRRPLIAKIHRDLFLEPKNHTDEVQCLDTDWAHALTRLFEHYTPVVIGYGGNDGSLMGFLENASIRGGLWWCYRANGEPPQRVKDLVAKKNWKLVPIIGFDEFMLELGNNLISTFDITTIASRIEELGQKRAKRYRDETEKVQEQINRPEATKQEGIQAVRLAMQSATEQPQDWWGWELKARAEADPAKRELIYHDGLQHFEQSAELTGNFANFMRVIRKDHDEAERLYRRALELDPNHTNITGNFANFMTVIRKDHNEAERLYRRALELDPNDANITGNFASFMTAIRKDHDEAERLYRRALELDPNDANITGNFASFMTAIRKDHDEAERLYRRALELDPNDANITANFAGFLLGCGRWNEAREYANTAANIEQTKESQTFAEIEFYRALLAVQHSQSPDTYLKSLKSLLCSDFVRNSWSFDAHLAAVAAYLDHDQRIFYRKLADAILDDAKLADLELLPEWQAIKALPDI